MYFIFNIFHFFISISLTIRIILENTNIKNSKKSNIICIKKILVLFTFLFHEVFYYYLHNEMLKPKSYL